MPQHTAPSTTRFAAFSDPVVYSGPSEDSKPVQHLLWGDWLRLKQGRSGEWREVHARGCDGWMHKDHIQTNRILEVVFVDIGQGDGCLVVTPDDDHIVIDAGEDDSMYRFLHWRYNGFKGGWTFAAGIMTHPDSDHYKGFHDLFMVPDVTFKNLFHNGIMERRGSGFSLGPKPKHGKHRYVTDLIRDKNALGAFLANTAKWKHPHSSGRPLSPGAGSALPRAMPGTRKTAIPSSSGSPMETSASSSAVTSISPPKSCCWSITPASILDRRPATSTTP